MHSVSAWVGVLGLALGVFLQSIALSFWLGRLSQRLSTVERSTDDRAGVGDKVIRLEVQMEAANKTLEKVGREMEGVNRQLGNIAMGHVGVSAELPGRK